MTNTITKIDVVDYSIEINRPNLPNTLIALQNLRTAKGQSDDQIHAMLDKMYAECKVPSMMERLFIHIGDVSRKHNIFKELGIKSESGGAQEREIFRSICRWWVKNMPKSFKKNLKYIPEFTVYENLMYFELRSDRFKGTIKSAEELMPMEKEVWKFLKSQIQKGKDIQLIARHLPKYNSGTKRTTKKVIRLRKDVTEANWTIPPNKEWITLNGKKLDLKAGDKIKVKTGDIVSYPRNKQKETIEKQKRVNTWIHGFCSVMDWSISDYKQFRKKQNTPEQKFSSGNINNLSEIEFYKFLDGLTSSQRFRVSCILCNKDKNTGKLVATEKWNKLGNLYINWEHKQELAAQSLREAVSSGDKDAIKKAKKNLKVKATGIQTVELLAKMINGKYSTDQVDTTYEALVSNMDLIAKVFPVIDGSASMNSSLTGWYNNSNIDPAYGQLDMFQIAAAMTIAFSTRNPVKEFVGAYGYFSSNFRIVGRSKYKNTSPNSFVDSEEFTTKVDDYKIISPEYPFSKNLNNMIMDRRSNGEVSSTNMFAVIDFFVNLVKQGKFTVEDLPQCLLFITDTEHNTGKSPKEAINHAASIGWNPLMIWWGLQQISERLKREVDTTPNLLLVGGFSESVLSQILRGIKKGSINPQDELWSIYEDKRYSMIS